MDGSASERACEEIYLAPEPRERRQIQLCSGVSAEPVLLPCREPVECRYCGPSHLLIAYERLARHRGVTWVDGLPESRRQNLSQTFTFVPAGHHFREWNDSDFPSRALYIYLDPSASLFASADRRAAHPRPRLHFQSVALWHTVLKVKALVERGEAACSRYAEALGVLLAHELLNSEHSAWPETGGARGGLLVWQRRRLAQYIDDHLAEQIPIARLAEIARLSRYHFCRSFRQSFGASPHRFHALRKIEWAKVLLANPAASITGIALEVGFQETSSFTAAFRRLVGQTPTGYRRSLACTV